MSDLSIYRQLNDLEERLRRLETVERPAFVGARYTTGTAQSFASGVVTVVNYDVLNDDPLSLVTPGAGWVFTCPVAGRYLVTAAILFDGTNAWAAGEAALLAVPKNGLDWSTLDRADNLGGGLQYMHLSGSDYVVCAAGDTLRLVATQFSGGALILFPGTSYNYVSIVRVG